MAVMCPVVSMTHTGSEPKEKSHKNKKKLSKNQMKLRVIHIWSNRGCTVRISQKLVVKPPSNLTCIFLSVRLNLRETFQCGVPCTSCHFWSHATFLILLLSFLKLDQFILSAFWFCKFSKFLWTWFRISWKHVVSNCTSFLLKLLTIPPL